MKKKVTKFGQRFESKNEPEVEKLLQKHLKEILILV